MIGGGGVHRVSGYPMPNGSGIPRIPWIPWIVLGFFGTRNVLEKIYFFRIVLELFLNSDFLTINFLGYNTSGCPLVGSPICDNILFQFCPHSLDPPKLSKNEPENVT